MVNMMKSVFVSIVKKEGSVDVELKCGSLVKGVLGNVDSQLNMILLNATYEHSKREKKTFDKLLIRASSIKYVSFTKQQVNPQSIQSAWYSLAK